MFTVGTCWFQFFISGVFYGLSPLSLPVASAFVGEHDVNFAGGVIFYGFAVLMAMQSITCGVAIFCIDQRPIIWKQRFITSAYCVWPLGFASLALAVRIKSIWMLLALGFPLLGYSIGVQVGYLQLVLTSTMWGRRVNVGQSLTGGCSALGALSWNLIFGEVSNALGFDRVETALWIFCALQTLAMLTGLALFNPSWYIQEKGEDSGDGEEDGDSETTTTKAKTIAELMRDWRFHLYILVVEAFFFSGVTMKTLMSELFKKILALEYIHAVRYSAGCMAAYAVARFASPFFAFGDNVFKLFVVVLVCEGAAYSVTPWAISLESGTGAIYTACRVVGGIGFAILKSNTAVLLVRIFGPENVSRISGCFLLTELVVGLGPSLAFAWHVEQMRSGVSSELSYNVFFYFCAGLVLAAACGTLALWQSTRTKGQRKGAPNPTSSTEDHHGAHDI